MDSILVSVKKLLGIAEENTDFDSDVIISINSVFTVLQQLGIGPSSGFSISDESAVWSDFIPEGEMMEAVKSYVALKVRLLFDPPTSGTIMQALTNMTNELEWRLNVLCDKTHGHKYQEENTDDAIEAVLGVILNGKY